MANNPSKFSDKIYYYQSANNDNKSIKENFVIRIAEFQQITSALLSKKGNDPLQHELILGRRGSGKSTLLKRIEIEINENEKLKRKYIAINFAEEQSSIYRLFDLWIIIIEELNDRYDDNIVSRNYNEFGSDEEYTRYLYGLIRQLLQEKKKRLVLLLDNFDRIVQSFHDDGNLLRETLINYNDIQIIGGSTRMSEHFWQYDQPFYEFFRRHHLESLSSREMRKLILHWSETLQFNQLKQFAKSNSGKIESIRILTDGLPRTLQFFIEILLDNSELYGYDYLKKIMDKVTPIYQERLNMLTPQLRKIVAEMAFLWEACSTKLLVEKCQMKSGLVSANLKTLINKGIVTKIETGKKNHLYRISERFFNMWFMVTQGNPTQKRKAKWLSIFLEHWYDKEEFKNLVDKHIQNLQAGKLSHNKLILASKGLSQSRFVSVKQRDRIIELSESIQGNAFENLIPLPEKFSDVHIKMERLVKEEKFNEAIKLVKNIDNEQGGDKFFILGFLFNKQKQLKEAKRYYLQAVGLENLSAMNNLAVLYEEQGEFKEAEHYYLQAIALRNSNAMFNLGLMYEKQKKNKEAERYYLQAIELGDSGAMFNLGLMYEEEEKNKEAKRYYMQAAELGNSKAMFNLGSIYEKEGKNKEAERYYIEAVELGSSRAMNNLAILYEEQEEFKEAEHYYIQATELGDSNAMFNLGLMYKKQEKFKEAEHYYIQAVELRDITAMNNLAILYQEQEKDKEAERYYLQAAELGSSSAMNNLALIYQEQEKDKEAEHYYLQAIELGNSNATYNLGLMYQEQEKDKEAERYYLQAAELGISSAMNNLGIMYQEQRKDKEAEHYYIQSTELGDTTAMNNLGIMYQEQEKDKEAEYYYLQATELGDIAAMNNLGLMYQDQGKNKEAEHYYIKAVELGDLTAMHNLALSYYSIRLNKEKALESIKKIHKEGKSKSSKMLLLEIIIEIWNGVFYNVEERILEILEEFGTTSFYPMIKSLLVQKQSQVVFKLFHHPTYGEELKDRYLILYYATLKLNDKKDKQLLSIPPELEETLEEVLEEIRERQKFYGYEMS